jgi:DNA-binding NarL/FixJ family response regulator
MPTSATRPEPREHVHDRARPAVRILVVDDREVVRVGLRALLGAQPWIACCITVRSAADALAHLDRIEPHVVLVTRRALAETGVREACLVFGGPDRTIGLLVEDIDLSAAEARFLGVSAVIPDSATADVLLDVIGRLADGEDALKPGDVSAPGAGDRLSPREHSVLGEIARGRTNREIAEVLHLSPHTIKHHSRSLYRKLSARNRAEAVRHGQRLGLIA